MRNGLFWFLGAAVAMVALTGWLLARENEGHHTGDDDFEEIQELLEVFEVLAGDLVAPSGTLSKVGKGQPVEIELSTAARDGRRIPVWEVEVVGDDSFREVAIDARSGEILSTESEDGAGELEEWRKALSSATVTMAQALATVEKTVEGRVVAAEFDVENGAIAWEVLVVHGGRLTEIVISATTGKIVPGEDEDDDEEEEGDD